MRLCVCVWVWVLVVLVPMLRGCEHRGSDSGAQVGWGMAVWGCVRVCWVRVCGCGCWCGAAAGGSMLLLCKLLLLLLRGVRVLLLLRVRRGVRGVGVRVCCRGLRCVCAEWGVCATGHGSGRGQVRCACSSSCAGSTTV